MDKPSVFISYSRKDVEFVRRLARDLEQAGYNPWWDVADLRGGQTWAAEIEKQVRACDSAIVVLTPASTASEWVNKETLLALDLKKPIVPIMLRDSTVPLPLIDRQWVDFRRNRDEALQALIQALPALPGPIPTAGQGLSAAGTAIPDVDEARQRRARVYITVGGLAAVFALLTGLAWLFRSPLNPFFGAPAGLLPTSTLPATTPAAQGTSSGKATAPPTLVPATSATSPAILTQTVLSPTTVLDYSAELQPVREHGTEGSVVGFAVAAALEYQIQKVLGKQLVISPRYIYYHARLKGGLSTLKDTGANVGVAIGVLKEQGAVLEDAWPYKAGEFAMEPPDSVEQAPHFGITESVAIHTSDELKHALKQYGPVVGSFPLFRDVFDVSVAATGMIWMPDSNRQQVGNLAVCFVGYDDEERLFKFRGSWSRDWGDQGYGYVSYDYADEYLSTAWAILGLTATRVNDKDGAVYVLVPAGEFQMGSAQNDSLAMPGEKPQHALSTTGLWLMQTEVTNAQYARCVSAGACTAQTDDIETRRNENANYPITGVTWHQASDYAKWAGGRLPTEAEWEKACRGTDARLYPWGNDPPTETRLNCSCTSDNENSGTTPVGGFPDGASPYGVLDMAGNVWEWTGSLWGDTAAAADFRYPYDAQDGREDLAAPDEVLRVLRGGSFQDHNTKSVRCAVRLGGDPGSGRDYIGFRVVLPL